ncbi:hypothetical protein [Paenibacillus sp. FSL H3-0333]|uniref:hypothetical protein n=1 Tax=Paenibacillus sp. FSL H3-0333 TaxID=2921373 RepID=UPI0030F8D6CF
MELKINTSLPIYFEEVETIEDARFLKGKIWICHTGKNLNNTNFDKQVIQDAIPSLANIPVLGFIQKNTMNESDFRGHEQRIVIDKDGVQIEYVGRAYGIVPESNNAKFEMKLCDDGIEREFLTSEVLFWRKFPESTEIIERDLIKNHSMELFPASINGSFTKEGVFNFTQFQFDGLCLLGDDVTPAMKGSILEKYSEIKNTANYSDMLQQFNTYYSEYTKQKGGEKMDEKLELMKQFSNLTEDRIAEIKANIESYSLDELNKKLTELNESKDQNEETPIPQTFSLTATQMQQEIRKALGTEKYTDRWGDSCKAYWYIDHDDTRVYAEDVQNGYTPVGLNYSLSGDFVTIDFATKKRVKFVPQDMENVEEAEGTTTFVSIERNDFNVEQAKTPTEDHNDELEELRNYKAVRENEDKSKVIDSFTQLTKEELDTFKGKLDQYTKDELELQLFALVGKKGLHFSTNSQQPNLIYSLNSVDTPATTNLPEWANYVEQYKSKQK